MTTEISTTDLPQRLALAEHLKNAFSDEAEEDGTQAAEDGSIQFWVSGTDREYHADSSLQLDAMRDHGAPEGCDEAAGPWIEHASTHSDISDGEFEWPAVYLLPQHRAILELRTSLGEYTDDDYDLYLHGRLSFVAVDESMEDKLREAQQRLIDQFIGYLGYLVGQEIRSIPQSLLDPDDPLFLGKLETAIRKVRPASSATGAAA